MQSVGYLLGYKSYKMAGHIMLGWNRYSHSLDILRELNWLSIAERVKFHTGVMMIKYHQKQCPKYLYESIQYLEDRQCYSTRATVIGLPLPSNRKLVCGQKSFSYQAHHVVRSFDFNMYECHNLNVFKVQLNQYLVNVRV